MRMNVKEVIELLEQNGWCYVRTSGDHHKFMKVGAKRSVIVPGAKSNKDIPIGTLKRILREAGINLSDKK